MTRPAGVAITAIAAAVWSVAVHPAQAQEAGQMVRLFQQGNIDTNALPDLTIPEAPAFAILGVDPQSVSRPATPRRFGADLLNGLDDNGNFQAGVALDVSPYRLAAGPRLTIANYRASYAQRLVSRTQFSLATAKGASDDDTATRLALGLSITPFDLGDPRMDLGLDACFDEKVTFEPATSADQIIRAEDEDDSNTAFARRIAAAGPAIRKCREERAAKRWNRAAWQLGIAPAWIDQQVEGNDSLDYNGFGVWTSLSWGFEGFGWLRNPDAVEPAVAEGPLLATLQETSQLILHARYIDQQDQLDPELNTFFETDTTFVGARLRVGAPDFSCSVDASYNYAEPSGPRHTDSFLRMSGSVTVKAPWWEDIWIDATAGRSEGRRLDDHTFVNVSLRFGPQRNDADELALRAAAGANAVPMERPSRPPRPR
jgi:hypothetical protein